MNFDELQKQWNQQSGEEMNFEEILHQKSSEVKTIVHILRKNIRQEFTYSFLCFLFILILPHLGRIDFTSFTLFFYYFMVFQIFLAGFFYYRRFYFFYHSTQKMDLLTTRENMLKLYYDLKFAVESYKTISYVILPSILILLLFFLTHSDYQQWSELFSNGLSMELLDKKILWILGTVFCTIVFTVLAIEWTIHHFYGKYVKQIKTILDDFDA